MSHQEISASGPAAGLTHVREHLQSHIERQDTRLDLIRSSQGNPDACMSGLTAQAVAAALVAWFVDNDLPAFKQACYVAAKIDRIRQQNSAWFLNNELVGNLFESWYWLVSDCEPLIAWRRESEPFMGWTGDELRPRGICKSTFDDVYVGYQLVLALRGDWARLGERAERWLADPPPSLKKVAPDMRFFAALSKGDIPGMEDALREIVTRKQRRWRENWQGGYSGRLISDEAVVYAKLAWRHGYQVDIDTPYIPKEWLPVSPLAEYVDVYGFMKGFDISQPLPDG